MVLIWTKIKCFCFNKLVSCFFVVPGGKACPLSRYLTEVQHCPTTIECAIYIWHTGDWRTCQVTDENKLCGPGTQVRDIGCYTYPAGHPVADQRFVSDTETF